MSNGGAGGIAARGQIYMGTPIGVVEIHLQLEIAAPPHPPPPPLCSATVCECMCVGVGVTVLAMNQENTPFLASIIHILFKQHQSSFVYVSDHIMEI